MKLSNLFTTLFVVFLLIISQKSNAQTVVGSLAELRVAVQNSDQNIVLTPGDYNITDLPSNSRSFPCSGSNNTIILTGVYIDFPVDASSDGHFLITGDGNTITGGVLENTYASGIEEITDYVAYNNDRDNLANGADPHFTFRGNGNTLKGTKMTVRGSFPYGYGSIYGIGSSNVFGLNKRGGIAVQGPNTTIDGCELQMRAFGHGIYIQDPADNTLIKNTLVEGAVRLGADMLADNAIGSLPYRSDFLMYNNDFANPEPIDSNKMFSLCEDGLRVYNGGGSVVVENCTVKKMRGGIRLYLSSSASVTNSKAIDCGATNINMPSDGTVINSTGNFAYAPLSDFRLSRSNTNVDLTIIPSPHATGSHNIVDILGSNHEIVFHRTPGPIDTDLSRAIVVTDDNSTIVNETEYPIILESTASGNTIYSCGGGVVTDNGSGNSITSYDDCSKIELPKCGGDIFSRIEAENFCKQSGVRIEDNSQGTENIGYLDKGDWTMYEVDFAKGVENVSVSVAGKNSGNIQFRLGSITGDLIGTASVPDTNDWQGWTTVAANISDVSGIQDLYLVYTGGFNMDYFQFIPTEASLGTDDVLEFESTVTIFPNPVFNVLHINNGIGGNIEIYDSLGKSILNENMLTNKESMDTSNLKSGLYFVKFKTDKGTFYKTIVKK